MIDLERVLARARGPARLAFLGVVLLATLTPFDFDADPGRVLQRLMHGLEPGLLPRDLIDGARNVVLFAGWGAVWVVTAPIGRLREALLRATLTGLAISVTVELCQLAASNRTASVLDVLTNASGAAIGASTIVLLIFSVSVRRRERSFVGIPAFSFGACYTAATILEAFSPLFRQAAFPKGYPGIFGRFRTVLEFFSLHSVLAVPFEDIPLFLPAGAFMVAALYELGLSYRQAARRVAVGGLLAVTAAEIGHGFLGQPIVLGAIAAHAAAIAAGAYAALRWLPGLTQRLRGADRPRVLLLCYATILILWAWRPYLPELDPATIVHRLTSRWWVPLEALGSRFDLFSVVDVCAPFFLYLPLGAMLAVWPLRHEGPFRGPLVGIYWAIAMEAGQLFLSYRFLDVTDMIVQASGVAIGWIIIRRAGFKPYGQLLAPGR